MFKDENDLYKVLKKRGPVIHYEDLKERLCMIHRFKLAKMLVKLMRKEKIVIGTTGGYWYIVVRSKGDIFDGVSYE